MHVFYIILLWRVVLFHFETRLSVQYVWDNTFRLHNKVGCLWQNVNNPLYTTVSSELLIRWSSGVPAVPIFPITRMGWFTVSITPLPSSKQILQQHSRQTIIFRNVAFGLKYESSSDEDEKEEGRAILPEAPITGTYNSTWASWPASYINLFQLAERK